MRMIRVIVRIDHGIDPVDSIRDELKAKLGRRIDEQSCTAVGFYNCTHPIALVARVW